MSFAGGTVDGDMAHQIPRACVSATCRDEHGRCLWHSKLWGWLPLFEGCESKAHQTADPGIVNRGAVVFDHGSTTKSAVNPGGSAGSTPARQH